VTSKPTGPPGQARPGAARPGSSARRRAAAGNRIGQYASWKAATQDHEWMHPEDCPGQPGAVNGSSSLIDEIVREGARRMLAEALQAEVDAYISQFAGELDGDGRRLVVRNGYHQSRAVLTSAGAVQVTVPRVNDKRTDPATGQRQRFSSAILPPWARKTPKVTEVLPLLYLHGLSSGDFVPALGQFLGSPAGLSAAVITKLTQTWQGEQKAFAQRDLSGVDYVYVWADGIHVNIRLEEHKLCLLVMIGVRAEGRNELIALADGYRESTESWADLRRDCARRGMRAPVLAAGDGALGSGARCARSSPGPASSAAGSTRQPTCWARCRSQPPRREEGPRGDLVRRGQGRALAAVNAFDAGYAAKFAKAAAKITDDKAQLLAFYDYPAEHWVHLRTTNPIESTFATVRHRTKVTKGPGSRAAGLAMAFKLIESAQDHWRMVNAPHLVALVRAGATFKNGKLVERARQDAA
jgi:transposase-like protein